MLTAEAGVCYRTLEFLGFPGYRVGDDGSVWSCRKRGGGYLQAWSRLKTDAAESGHLRVLLMPGRRWFAVHHLVLLAFVGPRPEGMQCRHFPDRNPTNNRVDNLRWGTHSENMKDRARQGTVDFQSGSKNHRAKLDEARVRVIRDQAAAGRPQKDIARENGLSRSIVSLIVSRKVWKHI